ncbi:hypothetical protein V7S43_014395 [Phytophthora oleae]|uniref:GAF domain-containing protein n=1 Tax=Phytophthora oleae TaxID=2107226 RepID=A0ABD3F4N0_9STRA
MAYNGNDGESAAQGSGDASIKSCKDPEIRRLSVTPLVKQRSSSPLSSIADMDLAELSLIDVLTQAATDVLGSIPAQRCVVYIYDKAANLLRPQVVVDCHDKDLEEAPVQAKDTDLFSVSGKSSDVRTSNRVAEAEIATSPLVSFPPVVGMVSSCFLQRRCLRMQEPNPHRSFHREYDVPKDIHVDSILCAPVILYHRATAVIQLLNRLDTARDRVPFEEVDRAATPHDIKNESTSEVKLRRLKTVKTVGLTGFSPKDEQKLLHFTTHIAQAIEINTKKLATVRSHAKIREDKAKHALELLNALNGKVVARVNSTDMLLSKDVGERTVYMRRATITRLQSQKAEISDILGALVVIMRLQALFRGRRVRRAEKFAEELEKFRRQRERMKTLIVMQRVVSCPEPPKLKVFECPPSGKARKPASRSKKRDKEPKKAPPSPKPPSTPSTPRPPQPVAPSPRPTQPTHIQKRRMSAVKIQKVFRRHRLRRKATELPSPVKPVAVSKEVVSAVKVQSFIRGNLVRKRLRRSLLSPKGPRIVCLRVASSSGPVSNQNSYDSPQLQSQTCVYAMPERPGKAPHAQRRISAVCHNQEQPDNELRPQNTQGIAIASRRLVAMHKEDDTRVHKSPSCRSRPRWGRLVPSVVWETAKNPELTPGVEFVKQHRLKDRKENSPRAAIDTNQKPTVRLPVLTSQPTSALLCCLLPAQTTSNGLIAARPISQNDRKAIRAKHRHYSPE